MRALGGEGATLHHAEAMLLVDYRERQRLEDDVLLDQRLRADHEIDVAAFDRRQQVTARRGGHPPRQQRDAIRPAIEGLDDRPVVLLGQDLGRRHERDLVVVLHRDDRRQERHDRLAGADIALQQALHRPAALHVGDDLGKRVALSFSQLERQHRARALTNPIVDRRHQALADLRILVAA